MKKINEVLNNCVIELLNANHAKLVKHFFEKHNYGKRYGFTCLIENSRFYGYINGVFHNYTLNIIKYKHNCKIITLEQAEAMMSDTNNELNVGDEVTFINGSLCLDNCLVLFRYLEIPDKYKTGAGISCPLGKGTIVDFHNEIFRIRFFDNKDQTSYVGYYSKYLKKININSQIKNTNYECKKKQSS